MIITLSDVWALQFLLNYLMLSPVYLVPYITSSSLSFHQAAAAGSSLEGEEKENQQTPWKESECNSLYKQGMSLCS